MTISTKMYAQALFEVSDKQPLSFLKELSLFEKVIKGDKEVEKYFNETYSEFDLVKDVLEKRFSNEFINFLEIIYENRIFKDLNNIKKNYETLLVENKYITVVKVVSAKKLNEKTKDKIIEMVEKNYKQPMRINYSIEEDLMAGFIIKVNNDIYDTSLKGKLDQIKNMEV